MMKILQLNCTSIRNKKQVFEQYIFANDISICCLSETFLMSDEQFELKNFSLIRSDRPSRSGGVAIALKKNINYKKLNVISSYDSIEICGCEVYTSSETLTILSVYLPPNCNLSVRHLNSVLSGLSCSSIIVCGDFNAHHINWGCSDTNARGRKVLEFIENEDFVLLNDGSPTYLGQSLSSIDLTFCSANVSLIADWSTKKETLGSTHCIIEISLNICLSSKSLVTHSVPKNIEKSFLNKKLSEIFLSNDFNDCDNLNKLELFSKRFNDSFKVKTSKKVKLPNPWWNAECNLASASLRRAVARFELCPSRENYSHLCNLRKKYKYIIRKEKSKGWKNFCASIDCQMTVSELWKTIRCFKGNYNNSMTAFNECLLEFCDQLAGPAGPFYYISPGQTQDDHFLLENFSYSELDKAILYSKNSAPGIDGLRNDHLKNFSVAHKFKLLCMFNEVLRTGNIPYDWFQYQVMPLKKKDGHPNVASSYRSIALVSTLRKLFERMICSRLEWYLESKNKLHHAQSGFRRGRSTSDNVIGLWSAVKLAFCKGEYVVAAFLDIKSAFEFVNIKLLSCRLKLIGVPRKFCDFIYCLFQFKDLYIQYEKGFINRFSFTGVPQGCVLSPICFNLYINEVFNNLPHDVHILAYADDIALFSSNQDPFIARTKVQKALDMINYKLQELQLSLSANKSKAMLFSNRITDSNLAGGLKINGERLQFVECFNFLGFVFHNRLNLRFHVDKVVRNCFQFVNILRSLCGVTWGSDPLCLLQLYIGLIRPKLEYMAPLLLDCNNTDLLKLQRIQWKCIRISLGVMMSSHTLAMEQIANVLPIPERYEMLSENIINKIISNLEHPARPFLAELACHANASKFVKKYALKLQTNCLVPVSLHDMFKLPLSALFSKTVVKFLPVKKKVDSAEQILNIFKNYVNKWHGYSKIYTDGSKTITNVGCGIWFPDIDIEAYFGLHPDSSIFTAEAKAILEALELIKLQNTKKFLIISDSKSVLTAISCYANSKTHPLIYKIKMILNSLKNADFYIHFLWVPSHIGIDGNEYVDKVASTHTHSVYRQELFVTDQRSIEKVKSYSQWQNRWNDSVKGRFLYNIAPNTNKTPWFKNIILPRPIISMINRLKINHTRCKDHIFKINIIDSNLCPCGEIQTTNHLLFCCANIARDLRKNLIDIMVNEGISNFEISYILKLDNATVYKAIHAFFTKAKVDI